MRGICLEVDIKQIVRTAESLRAYAGQAQGYTEELTGDLAQLDRMWKGKANQTFRLRMARELAQMDAHIKEARKFAACLEYAAEEYERTEREIREELEFCG